jgi:hypothetical protein
MSAGGFGASAAAMPTFLSCCQVFGSLVGLSQAQPSQAAPSQARPVSPNVETQSMTSVFVSAQKHQMALDNTTALSTTVATPPQGIITWLKPI